MPQENNAQPVEEHVLCNGCEATINGVKLPSPLSVTVGNEIVYKSQSETQKHGSFVVYRPVTGIVTFPITKNKTLRTIGADKKEMKKNHTMVFRWLAEDDTPVTTTNVTNVRFTSITQEKEPSDGQPYEKVVFEAESVTHD